MVWLKDLWDNMTFPIRYWIDHIKEKKQEIIEQRPPVIGGCFHVCKTLIFEVYQLLGGSLCDCVR